MLYSGYVLIIIYKTVTCLLARIIKEIKDVKGVKTSSLIQRLAVMTYFVYKLSVMNFTSLSVASPLCRVWHRQVINQKPRVSSAFSPLNAKTSLKPEKHALKLTACCMPEQAIVNGKPAMTELEEECEGKDTLIEKLAQWAFKNWRLTLPLAVFLFPGAILHLRTWIDYANNNTAGLASVTAALAGLWQFVETGHKKDHEKKSKTVKK